jgi:segregation and condensation protein B
MSNPEEIKLPMADSLQQVLGALVFGADHPLTPEEVCACLREVGATDDGAKLFAEVAPRDVREAMENIAKELARIGLGLELVEVGGGFRFQSQAAAGRWLRCLLKIDRPGRLSRPALETLAIIAYRQPIAKAEIESVRGVMVDHIIKALMELHLVRIVGRSDLPGRPFLYGTTASFLDHFGLKSLNELNAMDPTLQRSKPSERKAIHRKAKKEPDAPAGADTPADLSDAVREVLGPDTPPPPDAEPIHEPL